MSRLIFLNLPPTVDIAKLRASLKEPKSLDDTTVTDVRLVKKRRFAFVGYKTPDEARRAKEWFDGTFSLGGGKVKVDFVGDEPLVKPAPRTKIVQQGPPVEPSKHLQEFMQVMTGVEAGPSVKAEAPKSIKGKERDDSDNGSDVDDAEWLRKRRKGTAATIDQSTSLILSTGRLFLRNLSFLTTAADLTAHFSPFGALESVHLPVAHSGEPLGTAFILYRDPTSALAAYQALDKTTFQGRILHVLPGRARPGQEVQAEGVGKAPGDVLGKVKDGHVEVRGKVDAKRKDEGSKGVNWATMYMNSDAVAASVADRMGISKSELLSTDPSSSSISSAVKLALAETHVIAETIQYFADAGLNLEALQPKVPRSQTTILVKNIPYGTTIHTLSDLFTPHGETTRILVPQSGTLGVVEYKSPADAARAFKALSYKRLGNAVLYLEKGPVDMFTVLPPPTETLAERVSNAEVADQQDESGSTLFLKNLSFGTTTLRLQSILSTLPGYSFARVQTKPDPKRQGERLSMGYGFVGFKTRQDTQKALAGLQGFEVDGRPLEANFAQRGTDEPSELKGSTKGTKILVKNLPFEASKKEVRELFSAYGTMKSLRLPRKSLPTSTGAQSTRGFAFLEFTTHSEAARAIEALKHTHLLGRHLVLEWATEGEGVDVDALREKVGRESKDGRRGGKRRLDLGGGEEGEVE